MRINTAVVVAGLVTAGCMFLLLKYYDRLGLLDEPNGHREHHQTTPLIGGIAMYVGMCSGWVLVGAPLSLMYACFLVVVCGAWDDKNKVSSGVRFFFQILACGVMIYWGDIVLFDLGHLVDENLMLLGRWAVALTIFSTVGVINSINMSDGMDGLAGSLVLLCALAILLLAWAGGMSETVAELSVLVSVVIVFLTFNIRFRKDKAARAFMGDAGSMLLGLVLAWYLIKHSREPDKLYDPVIALWFIGLPLFDAVGVLIRRTLKGRSPFKADRMHYHHYLLEMGFNVPQVLLIIALTTIGFIAVGLVGHFTGVPEHIMFYTFILLFLLYLLFMEILERRITQQAV